ncbi:xanthine dehydrogenase family protein subunit M [bacterium]|nr:xanthine dehydrogenase family protein subunit M [bacterium]
MEFIAAESLDHALSVLRERGDEVTVLAGGTDVMVDYLGGHRSPSTLLHLRNLDQLQGIAANGNVTMGALVTHRELSTNPRVSTGLKSLAEAAATIGGRQTQNVGTVGGNLANASPAADTIAPLLVADAAVNLINSGGARTVPLAEFLVGRKQTALSPDELIESISATPADAGAGEVYLKVARRGAMEVAIVGMAARVSFDGDTVTGVRIAVCSVAPTPFRATAAEAVLTGSTLDSVSVTEAGRALQDAARPIDDPRASAEYRSMVLPGLLRRAVGICRDRAGHTDRREAT